ncbi:adenylate/guanylate cyclase domain-containing protein [Stigmatella sp. ncwal1]|uniref:Adenylate/guanylate cyclase domain-containing protein n=1 Tax=Stigmatella ashevillensis TaxID=2995309 RepID=A0ABT5D4G0_9BACT|nr:adenylate/guanylate cyclase domain-containing protein [Stigmatella ashevillena]MDC0707975.1 adenylate/guanylate cyclase domain-containing protein [Stigmatella ashevillena]
MKTANLAIVFTDIKGFTERTSRQTHEQNERLLQTHHALLAPIFKAFGGRILKSIGDAFLVTFESPTQAVLSGIAIQDRLWQYNRSAEEDSQLHVRVAVNVGEVRVESSDVFGEPVNIAARVEGITEAGEVFFTEAVYLAMNKAEVPSQEVGAFELKGIPGKIRVFRVPKAPYRVEAPLLPAQPPVEPASEGPPFGNIALSRIPETTGLPGPDLAATAAALGQHAAVLGQHAVVLGGRARTLGGQLLEGASRSLSPLKARLARDGRFQLPAGLSWQRLGLGLGALAVVLGVGVVALGGSAAERALSDVEAAPAQQRGPLVVKARKLIEQEKNPGVQSYLYGRLEEAEGSWGDAMRRYKAAIKAGEGDAEDRLIDLLEHPKCTVRVAAAAAVGELRLLSARGALKDLADSGGPDDEGGSGTLSRLFNCDSRRAAKSALERLKDG